MSKPKVIKDFEKLDNEIKQAILDKYPYGFDKYIITFKNHKNHLVSALPFETEEFFYMVKMTRSEANEIVKAYDEDKAKTEIDDTIEELEEIPNIENEAASED